MKVFNKSNRTFNAGTPFVLYPKKWSGDLDDTYVKQMIRMYPRDLTTNDQPTGPSPREISLAKENEELKKKLAKFEASMTGLEKVATEPTKGIAFDAPVDPITPPAEETAPTPPKAPTKTKKAAAVV